MHPANVREGVFRRQHEARSTLPDATLVFKLLRRRGRREREKEEEEEKEEEKEAKEEEEREAKEEEKGDWESPALTLEISVESAHY